MTILNEMIGHCHNCDPTLTQCTRVYPNNYEHIRKLEFHRTHTLCTLSTVSTVCTYSNIVRRSAQLQLYVGVLHSLHVAMQSCIVCRQGMACRNTIFQDPFFVPLIELFQISFSERIAWHSNITRNRGHTAEICLRM